MDESGVPNDALPFVPGLYECQYRVRGKSVVESAQFRIEPATCPRARLLQGQTCLVPEATTCPLYGTAASTGTCACLQGAWSC